MASAGVRREGMVIGSPRALIMMMRKLTPGFAVNGQVGLADMLLGHTGRMHPKIIAALSLWYRSKGVSAEIWRAGHPALCATINNVREQRPASEQRLCAPWPRELPGHAMRPGSPCRGLCRTVAAVSDHLHRGRCGRLHPEAPMYKYTGRRLARWTVTGGRPGGQLREAPLITARLLADLAGIDRLGTDRRLRTEQVVLRIDDLPGRPEVDRFCVLRASWRRRSRRADRRIWTR